jgi:hypothetical protein
MKRYNSLFLTAVVLGSNLITTSAFANDPGFPGDPNTDPGQPVAPIDSWIAPMLTVAVALMFIIYSKKQIKETKK